MSTSNPSHLLLSRHPRSPAHPQLAPTLTSRHSPSPRPPSPGILGWGAESSHGDGAGGSQYPYPYQDDNGRVRALSAPLPPRAAGSASAGGFAGTSPGGQTYLAGGLGEEGQEEHVQIHPTFQRDAALSGRVRVVVNKHEFWCHKEVLWFASPFFQGLLEGNWAETAPGPSQRLSNDDLSLGTRQSSPEPDSSIEVVQDTADEVVVAQPRGTHDVRADTDHLAPSSASADEDDGLQSPSVYLDASDGPSVAEILRELREIPDPDPDPSLPIPPTLKAVLVDTAGTPAAADWNEAPPAPFKSTSPRRRSSVRHSFSSSIHPSRARIRASASRSASGSGPHPHLQSQSQMQTQAAGKDHIEAEVELHEESAAAFHDFLFWAYPHLECKVTWENVENLLALSIKLLVPALQRSCEQFLLSHASGRPVMAMMLAEIHEHAELYREASRFVLDQQEMADLSEATHLKLSQRRTWFLERLLKLGSIDVRKEYTCRPDCPEPSRCQVQLDEKWRMAQQTVCRYGPPQPSVAFRCLRQLETFPTNPSLVMQHPLCQSAAKAWCATLFDRMFQPKAVASVFSHGTEKYWLFITLS